MSGKGKTPTTCLAAKAPGCPVSPDPDLRTLIQRADAGEDQARGEIRTLLSKPRTLATSGALRDAAETALLKASHGESWTAQEVGRRTLAQLRRDLAGPNPSPLERALADRLALALAEVDYIAALALPGQVPNDV